MNFFKKIKFNQLLIFSIVLNGVIVALIKYAGISIPTSPINIIILFSFILFGFLFILNENTKSSLQGLIKTLCVVTFIFITLKLVLIIFSLAFELTDFIIYIMYLTAFLLCYHFSLLNQMYFDGLIKIFSKSFFIVAFIYWIQYFFHNSLPEAFTEIPNLFEEVGAERYTRELVDLVVYRANALIGNPINLGFYLNLIFCIYLFKNFTNKSFFNVSILLLIAIMILLLFSRANFIFMILQVLGYLIITNNSPLKLIKSISVFILIITASLFLFSNQINHQYNRLVGDDEYAQASTDEHLKDYNKAIEYIIDNPVLGINPHENSKYDIITDGAIFNIALNAGIPFSLFYMFIIILILSKLLKYSKYNRSQLIFIIFLIITIPYSIINSAILNKGVFLLFHIFAGIVISNVINTHKMQVLVKKSYH